MVDLPDELKLPLGSGEPWWYWLGGRPSLDFVNTLRERWWRNVETLVTPADLVLLAGARGAPAGRVGRPRTGGAAGLGARAAREHRRGTRGGDRRRAGPGERGRGDRRLAAGRRRARDAGRRAGACRCCAPPHPPTPCATRSARSRSTPRGRSAPSSARGRASARRTRAARASTTAPRRPAGCGARCAAAGTSRRRAAIASGRAGRARRRRPTTPRADEILARPRSISGATGNPRYDVRASTDRRTSRRRGQGDPCRRREQRHDEQAPEGRGRGAERGDAPRAARAALHDRGRRRAHQRRDPLRRDLPPEHGRRHALPAAARRARRDPRHQGRHGRQAARRARPTRRSPRASTACASASPSTTRAARASRSGAP